MVDQRIFPPLSGIGYIKFLKEIHRRINPVWYLEVGSFKGESLKNSTAKTVVVDPFIQLGAESIQGKPQLHLFQMTSDEFFDAQKNDPIADKYDLVFLDGMHLFEFLLRDFIGAEKLCASQSTIVMHDCIPITSIASMRERNSGTWTGDVWKLVPILRKYRPDLTVEVLDCPPSGLTIISNLDSENNILIENYEQILKEYLDETIDTYGADKLFEELDIVSSRSAELISKIGVS